MKRLLYLSIILILMPSCENADSTMSGNTESSSTMDATNVSCVSAIISSKANLGKTVASDLMMGIMYSESSGVLPSTATIVEATEIDAKYNYSITVAGLKPNTTYYYRSYIYQNGMYTYGQTKSFTTKPLSSMLQTAEATSISPVSAQLNAKLNMTDVQCSSKSFGFYWGNSATSLNSKLTSITEQSNSINGIIKSLTPAAELYYQAYARIDGNEYREEIRSFTTPAIETIIETYEADHLEASSAKLHAKLDLTEVRYSSLNYGFYYGMSENTQNTSIRGGAITEGAYYSDLTSLTHNRQYWYKAYVRLDNSTYYGDVKSFTTGVIPVKSVSVDPAEYAFSNIGDKYVLNAVVSPADATNQRLTWTSDNEAVATVSSDGEVTAKGNGVATITVITQDQNKTATCAISVAQKVIGLSLDRTSITLNEGESEVLVATIIPVNANEKNVTWKSSNESVASVDNTGRVMAVSKGLATITVMSNDESGESASCSVIVNRLVSSIAFDKTSLVIYNGESVGISATVIPSDASNSSIDWTSSNTSVATVSASGEVKGLSRGYTTITGSSKDGSDVRTTCVVEVRQYVTGIALNTASIILNEGQSQTLLATITPDNANDKSITWSSSDANIANVDSKGLVRAISKGIATITAIANDGSGRYVTCSVTVRRLVSSIVLNKSSLVLHNDETETLSAVITPSDADNLAVTWTSSNSSVATVSSSGLVTGKARGATTITVTANDGSGVGSTCEVEVKQYVTNITLSKTSLSRVVGEEETISVTNILPDNANDKTYT